MESIRVLQDLAQSKENVGDFQASYQLYMKALFIIIRELQQVTFVDQSTISETTPAVDGFKMAYQCLQCAEVVRNSASIVVVPSNKADVKSSVSKSPPPVPPKPRSLTENLITRPSISISNTKGSKTLHDKGHGVSKRQMLPHLQLTNAQDLESDTENSLSPRSKILGRPSTAFINNNSKNVSVVPQLAAPSPLSHGSVASLRRKLDGVIYRRASSPNLGTSASQATINSNRRGSSIKNMLTLPHLSRNESKLMDKEENALLPSTPIEYIVPFFLFDNSIDTSMMMEAQTSQDENLTIPGSHKTSNNIPHIPIPPLQIAYKKLSGQTGNVNSEWEKEKSVKNLPELSGAAAKSLVQRLENFEFDITQSKASALEHKTLIDQLRTLHVSATAVQSILQFRPQLVAYQLTLIDSSIFRSISTNALIEHSPKTPHPRIVASTDFFNYLTRFIEHSILLPQEASVRAQLVNHWIKISSKCLEFQNFQTLKAIVSSLGTPPIQRLKRTWSFVPKKNLTRLEVLNSLMSESCNYRRYRERLGITLDGDEKNIEGLNVSKPIVPFLGTFIHDVTYITAFIKSYRGPSPVASVSTPTIRQKNKITVKHKFESSLQPSGISAAEKLILEQDPRFVELIRMFEYYQSLPDFKPTLPASVVKSLHKSRRTRISDALKSASSNKLGLQSTEVDKEDLPLPMQQAIVTQYLLTRLWVTERVIDELSVIREPARKHRSNSESSSYMASSLNSNANISVNSATSSIVSYKSNSINGLRSSSGSCDSDNPCTSGDDMLPTHEKLENEMFGKDAEMRRGTTSYSDKKESRHLWSFSWRRGSMDEASGHDSILQKANLGIVDLPNHVTSDRRKIWADEFWQTSPNEQTRTRPTFNMTRRALSHDVADRYHNSVPPPPSGIHLLSFEAANTGQQNQFQADIWSHAAAEDPPSWEYTGDDAEDVQPKVIMMDSLAPWHPVNKPGPM